MNIQTIFTDINNMIQAIDLTHLAEKIVLIIPVVILILAGFTLLTFALGKTLKNKISEGSRQVLKKVIRTTGYLLAVLYIFISLGINITPLLGAAGIAGVVIGFAAQTSVSNIISGFFLLSEKSFVVGDLIKVDDILGFVISVDSLSVKLRTIDNLLMRIPNETIIKSNLTTITRFPIRRLDVFFTVTYEEDLERLRDLLMDIAAQSPVSLDNPAPLFVVDSFTESGYRILFALWAETPRFMELKTSTSIDIQKRFKEQGIILPYKKLDVSVSA